MCRHVLHIYTLEKNIYICAPHIHLNAHIHSHVCMYVCMYVRMYVCMYVSSTYLHIYMNDCLCVIYKLLSRCKHLYFISIPIYPHKYR